MFIGLIISRKCMLAVPGNLCCLCWGSVAHRLTVKWSYVIPKSWRLCWLATYTKTVYSSLGILIAQNQLSRAPFKNINYNAQKFSTSLLFIRFFWLQQGLSCYTKRNAVILLLIYKMTSSLEFSEGTINSAVKSVLLFLKLIAVRFALPDSALLVN